MRLFRHISAAILGFRSDQSGVTAPIIAIMFTGLVGMAGYAIDMSHVMWVQRQLQSSADAAALAGALVVGNSAKAGEDTATSYSGMSGQKNEVMGASSVSTTAKAKCYSNKAVLPACGDTTSRDNVITVTQIATVPTYFLKIFGLNNFTPTATATASAKGGSGTSLNVMVVLDTTQSMKDADPGCSGGTTKMACAKAGAAALISGLNSSTSKVGFMTYPPVNSQGVKSDTTCNGGTLGSSNVERYKSVSVSSTSYNPGTGATYTLADLGSPTGTVSTTLVGTNTNCKNKGIQAVGGVGTYFADAVTAAQYVLTNSSNAVSNAQNVIILLSDGDAGADSSDLPSGKSSNQCTQAVTNAEAVSSAHTWVYTVAYGANSNTSNVAAPSTTTNTTNNGKTGNQKQTTTTKTTTTPTAGCTSDTGKKAISPCDTMKNMASDSGKFYSDGAGVTGNIKTTVTVTDSKGNTVGKPTTTTTNQTGACNGSGGNSTDLVELFKEISESLTLPRLIPNNTSVT